jgi:hypothetical protein
MAGVVAACGGDEITTPVGDARVRLVNASFAFDLYELSIDEELVAQNVSFGPGSCIDVPSGLRSFIFHGNGGEITTLDGNLAPDVDYALLLYDDADGEPAVGSLITDVQTPAAGQNALRFVNISGANGDVFLTDATTDPSGDPAIDGLDNERFTAFGIAEVEQSVVWLFPDDEVTEPIASITLPALSERIGTVVFVGAGRAGGETALVFEPCPVS